MRGPAFYYVYVMMNHSGTVLYVGVTRNLENRVEQHRHPNEKAFTTRYRVHRLVYFEVLRDIREAIRREKELKGWRRERKEALIRSRNPRLRDLAPPAGSS